MANPPLVKSNWIVNEDGMRVIDNNLRAEERISSYYKEQNQRQFEEELNYDSFSDEFEGGLNAEQLDALTMDQTNILSSADNGGAGEQTVDLSGTDDSFERATSSETDSSENQTAAAQQGAHTTGDQIHEQATDDIARIIDDAQTQADSIVRKASEEADHIRAQAHDEGYEQGIAEGREQGIREVSSEQDEDYERKCKQLDAEYQRALDELEPKLVDTLTRVYEHVFDVNLANDKKIILHLLRTAMSRSGESGSFIIHVSPDDYDDVAEEKDNLRAAIPNPNTTMEVIEDPLLKSMECMIEADGGIFDCSLGVELSELSRKLRLLAFDRRRN